MKVWHGVVLMVLGIAMFMECFVTPGVQFFASFGSGVLTALGFISYRIAR